MEKTYSRLTEEERCEIYRLHALGITQSEIALRLGRDKGAISRELRRNTPKRGRAYNLVRAQNLADLRAWRGSRLERSSALREAVFDRLDDIILNHNDMPRNGLGWRTPFEAFINDLTQIVALQM